MRPYPQLRVCGIIALVLVATFISSGLVGRVSAAGTDIVFVARAHLATQDDIFSDEVGPAGEFGTGLTKFAPGSKLMIRHGDGSVMTLVDGSNPTAATSNLIDVQAPDVSFDATKILFAGATTVDPDAADYGWRLYEIGVNGQGLRKLPIPDRTFTAVPNNNSAGYAYGNYETYHWWNDIDPAYLADGRIVFASTRYPARANYDERHDYNLYVVNSDGSNLHRITTERASLLHPTPLPDGRIIFARWWNNFNQPSSTGVYNRIDNRATDHTLADGTLIKANPDEDFNPATGTLPDGFAIRDAPNAWHISVVNPDGTDFHRYAFTPYADWARTYDDGNDTYTAAQPALVMNGGKMYVAYTSQQDGTMVHGTQKTGIRVALPGPDMLYANIGDSIAGLTYDRAWNKGDYSAPYAIHPAGMPDGTILFSFAKASDSSLPTTGHYNDRETGRQFDLQGSDLQYKLFTMNLDGSNKVADAAGVGTADAMDAKPIVARTGWTSLADRAKTNSSDDPKQWNLPADLLPGPYGWTQKTAATIQTATLHNPNVYANASLDMPFINNSPPPGSVATAEVWVDADQFTGAYCYDDYPDPCDQFKQDVQVRAIKYTTVPVSARGEFTAQIPADVPAFIVLRNAQGKIVDGWNRGYATIAQGNAYARPGQTVTCIGCHFGHVSGSITNVAEATAGWTNVAPYAKTSASSEDHADDQYQPFAAWRVNDRQGFIPAPAGGPPNPASQVKAFALPHANDLSKKVQRPEAMLPLAKGNAPNAVAADNPNDQDTENGWMSIEHDTDKDANGEWVQMKWATPVKVKSIRLIGPPPTGGDWSGFGQGPDTTPYHITAGTLALSLGGTAVGSPLQVGEVEAYADGGTQVNFNTPIVIDALKFTVNSTAGYWYWSKVAAVSEIEVMGMDRNASPLGSGPTATPTSSPTNTPPSGPTSTPMPTATPGPCAQGKPAAATLGSPVQGAKVNTRAVGLDWNDVACATKYKVVVRLGSESGSQVVKGKATDSGYMTTALTAGKTYWWQVKACDGAGCTASAWSSFKVVKQAQ